MGANITPSAVFHVIPDPGSVSGAGARSAIRDPCLSGSIWRGGEGQPLSCPASPDGDAQDWVPAFAGTALEMAETAKLSTYGPEPAPHLMRGRGDREEPASLVPRATMCEYKSCAAGKQGAALKSRAPHGHDGSAPVRASCRDRRFGGAGRAAAGLPGPHEPFQHVAELLRRREHRVMPLALEGVSCAPGMRAAAYSAAAKLMSRSARPCATRVGTEIELRIGTMFMSGSGS